MISTEAYSVKLVQDQVALKVRFILMCPFFSISVFESKIEIKIRKHAFTSLEYSFKSSVLQVALGCANNSSVFGHLPEKRFNIYCESRT